MPTVGAGTYWCRRRYTSWRAGAWALVVAVPPAAAQERVHEHHEFASPEGRLLAFYAAAMAFSPAGIAPGDARLAVSLEISHVPALNEAQRRPSIDKPESTNLAPLFPRPRLLAAAGDVVVEVSWIPPMRVFDVEANIVSAALSAPALRAGPVVLRPRLWGVLGRVTGAMTCSATEMVNKGPDLALYYATVCHGRESEDWFEPRMAGGEIVGSRPLGSGAAQLYALAGARVDRTRFDIGVLTTDGARDSDHPILYLRAVRPHAAVGASWRVRRGVVAGGELFYAPGSLLTARLSGRWVAKQ